MPWALEALLVILTITSGVRFSVLVSCSRMRAALLDIPARDSRVARACLNGSENSRSPQLRSIASM
jgi:hypothetical protein